MYIFLLLLLCYGIFLLSLTFVVLFKKHPVSKNKSIHPVSIVIPFRNEQNHLATLLQSLKNQTYTGQFEILLINDGSTDESTKVIENNSVGSHCEIFVLNSPYKPDRNLTSKQQALDFGILQARFNWIALTDADMKLQPNWLNSLMENACEGVDLVFGHTSIIGPKTVFCQLQTFQLEFLFAIAYAFFHAGISGSCMGNNILISKHAYEKTGGQQSVGYNIVEDRGLLNLFRKKRMVISCTNPFLPLALTVPCSEWKHFFHQIRRWAYGGFDWRSNLLPIALLFSVQNLFLLLACTTILPTIISISAASNFLLTWLFIAVTFKKINAPQRSFFFPFFYIFLFFESVLFLFSIITKSDIEWKGRKINHT